MGLIFTKKKERMMEDLADLYLLMAKYVPSPDSTAANKLFLNIAGNVSKDGEMKFVDILGDKYIAENSNL